MSSPSRPDLSHLLATEEGRALYRRLALAEVVYGWRWICDGEFFTDGKNEFHRSEIVNALRRGVRLRALPDPENDPAAAWKLMVREHCAVGPHDLEHPEKGWVAVSERGSWVSRVASPAAAVVKAVLHKYATGPHADLMRPLLGVEDA